MTALSDLDYEREVWASEIYVRVVGTCIMFKARRLDKVTTWDCSGTEEKNDIN